MRNILLKYKNLVKSDGIKKYFFNTSWLIAEKILQLVTSLFVGIWLARYLGSANFGLFSFAISFAGLFSTMATLGLEGIVIRELVKSESQRDVILGTAFILKLIGSFLMILLMIIFSNLIPIDNSTKIMTIIIASAAIFQSFGVINYYFQGKVLSRYIVFANISSLSISTIIKIILILNKAPLILFVWIILFDSFIIAIGFIYFYVKMNLSLLRWQFNWSRGFLLLKDSWPLIITGVLVSIYMKIDQVMIKVLLGNEAVGQYAAAVKLSEAWYFIPSVILSSLFPAIINAKIQNEDMYYSRLRKLYNFMALLAISIAIPMTFLSDWIVDLLYGGLYNHSGSVLRIHIWSGVFVFLGVASSKWLLTENLQVFSIINTSIGAIVNIILNYVLIKKIGIDGSAWATLIAYFFAAYLCLAFFKKTRKNFIFLSKALLINWLWHVKKSD